MIESGSIANKSNATLLEDDDVISNYYDTLDSVSNSASETNNTMEYDENPMLHSMVLGTDTASY